MSPTGHGYCYNGHGYKISLTIETETHLHGSK